MKPNIIIVNKRNAWYRAYEINMGNDVLAWINIKHDNVTHYCSSPLRELDEILDPMRTVVEFDNFQDALKFCLDTIEQWAVNLVDELKETDFQNPQIEEEAYVASAGSMYGA